MVFMDEKKGPNCDIQFTIPRSYQKSS